MLTVMVNLFDSILWQPIVPIGFALVVIGVAVVLSWRVCYCIPRRVANTDRVSFLVRSIWFGMRFVVVGGLGVVLLGPSVVRENLDTYLDRPVVLFAVDTSQSMCVEDAVGLDGGAVGRLDGVRAHWLSEAFLAKLREVAQPRFYAFDETLREVGPGALKAGGRSTLLTEHIATLLRRDRGAVGVVLLTDGHDTSGDDPKLLASMASESGMPIHVVPTGLETRRPDVAVRLTADQSVVFSGQATNLRAEIEQTGFDDRSITVVLRQNDEVIDRRSVVLDGARTRVVFPVEPSGMEDERGDGEEGLCSYEIEVSPFPDEAVDENNRRHAFVRVTGEPIRVVLFENEPYWDTTFLIRTLRADAQVDLTTVIGMGRVQRVQRETVDEEVLFPEPLTEEWLSGFDVVLFGRGVERWFYGEALGAFERYLTRQGGTVVLARGVPVGDNTTVEGRAALDVIARYSPVRWGKGLIEGGVLERELGRPVESTVDFGALGDTDSILSVLPGMLAQTKVEGELALSNVWLRTSHGEEWSGSAAVATRRVGRGRVLAIMVDGLWRWAMLPSWYEDLDSVYDLFWMRTIRWLAGSGEMLPGRDVGLSVDRLTLEPDEVQTISVRTRVMEPGVFEPVLTVVGPDGREHSLEAMVDRSASTSAIRRYTALYTPGDEGVYVVRLENAIAEKVPGTFSCRFAVYDSNRERLDTSARPGVLEHLADSTGGVVFPVDQPERFLEYVTKWRQAERVDFRPEPIWDRWWIFTVVVLLLCIEWGWRRFLEEI